MSVLNYPNHIVYEIYTGKGYQYFVIDKTTEKVEEFSRIIEKDKKDVAIVDEHLSHLR
jgi:hypothetical protein